MRVTRRQASSCGGRRRGWPVRRRRGARADDLAEGRVQRLARGADQSAVRGLRRGQPATIKVTRYSVPSRGSPGRRWTRSSARAPRSPTSIRAPASSPPATRCTDTRWRSTTSSTRSASSRRRSMAGGSAASCIRRRSPPPASCCSTIARCSARQASSRRQPTSPSAGPGSRSWRRAGSSTDPAQEPVGPRVRAARAALPDAAVRRIARTARRMSAVGLQATGHIDGPEFVEGFAFLQRMYTEWKIVPTGVLDRRRRRGICSAPARRRCSSAAPGISPLSREVQGAGLGRRAVSVFRARQAGHARPDRWHLAINPRTPQPGGRVAFVNYMTGDDAQITWFQLRPHPPVLCRCGTRCRKRSTPTAGDRPLRAGAHRGALPAQPRLPRIRRPARRDAARAAERRQRGAAAHRRRRAARVDQHDSNHTVRHVNSEESEPTGMRAQSAGHRDLFRHRRHGAGARRRRACARSRSPS